MVGKLSRAPRAQKPSPIILMRIWIDQLRANYIGIREVHVLTAVAQAALPISQTEVQRHGSHRCGERSQFEHARSSADRQRGYRHWRCRAHWEEGNQVTILAGESISLLEDFVLKSLRSLEFAIGKTYMRAR